MAYQAYYVCQRFSYGKTRPSFALILVFTLMVCVSGSMSLNLYRGHNNHVNANVANGKDTCTSEYSCLNCTAVRLCIKRWNGTLDHLIDFQCDESTPYCDPNTGTCQTTLPSEKCLDKDESFICPSDGYFPDPIDCTKYYSCTKGVAYVHNCEDSHYYNAKSENCQGASSCVAVDCTDKSGVKVTYDTNSPYYGYCLDQELVRFEKCPATFMLDPSLQTCVPFCQVPGEQGDPYDCTKYYKCSYDSSWNLDLLHVDCPEGELYDSLNFHCTPSNTTLLCSSGHTTLINYIH